MSKPSPSTKKCYAITSTIGAVLKSNQDGHPKLLALQLQANRAMKVFFRKAGSKMYWNISNQVAEVWEKIAERHQNTIKEEEVPMFVEHLCTLIPPNDFKSFLAIAPYRTTITIDPQVNRNIIESILLMDEEINKICGTKAYALSVRKPKPIKVKRERDKSKKTKTERKPTQNQVRERERHNNVKTFLQKRIEEAKLKGQ